MKGRQLIKGKMCVSFFFKKVTVIKNICLCYNTIKIPFSVGVNLDLQRKIMSVIMTIAAAIIIIVSLGMVPCQLVSLII